MAINSAGEKGAVVVTGTSSGIGRATALELDRVGFRVFASVRKDADAQALLRDSPGITPLLMEVTDEKSVHAAADTTAAALGDLGLAGLVNNAGMGAFGPVEGIPLSEWRRQMEINVIGQVAVIQAFLPMLRQARGRIVNIGSVGGRTTIPFGGALCASKHAIEAINDALRMELRPWGIQVSLVAPGAIHTNAADRLAADGAAMMKLIAPDRLGLYEKSFRKMLRTMSEDEAAGSPPVVVARVIVKALTDSRPKLRYRAGKHSVAIALMSNLLPTRLFDSMKLKQMA